MKKSFSQLPVRTRCILLLIPMGICFIVSFFLVEPANWVFLILGIGLGIWACVEAGKYRCPKCNGKLSVRFKFSHCPHCGTALDI